MQGISNAMLQEQEYSVFKKKKKKYSTSMLYRFVVQLQN